MKAGPEIRAIVHFARVNLVGEAWPSGPPFDLVFCRNVLIYFDAPLQERVHALLYDSLRPGGILALGHGEALTRSMQDAYETLDEQTKLFVRR
jgi:chemotaxis protein methyltransferase CheR